MGTFCAGRYRVCRAEGLPRGVTMASEKFLGDGCRIEFRGRSGEDAIRNI